MFSPLRGVEKAGILWALRSAPCSTWHSQQQPRLRRVRLGNGWNGFSHPAVTPALHGGRFNRGFFDARQGMQFQLARCPAASATTCNGPSKMGGPFLHTPCTGLRKSGVADLIPSTCAECLFRPARPSTYCSARGIEAHTAAMMGACWDDPSRKGTAIRALANFRMRHGTL